MGNDDGSLLAACLIVRNEERNIGRCLASLDGLVDQIKVVDTGSTDLTVTIAREFGAEVVSSPWTNDFSFHRNQVMDMATSKWILVIDADESVVETDKEDTRTRLASGSLPEILMVREHLVYPGGKRLTVLAPRLLARSSGIRYVHPIHEQLDISDSRAMLSNVTLLHHGYAATDRLMDKERRNIEIARRMGEDSLHGLHSRARSALSIEAWEEVIECASALLKRDPPSVLAVEACVLGGLATCQAGDHEKCLWFLRRGKEIEPECSDLMLIELVDAATRYRDLLAAEGDSRGQGAFVRPWMLWHDADQVSALLDGLLGRRKVVVTAGPQSCPEGAGDS